VGFIAELKRRNVIRMAGLYLVAAWLLIQVASTVLPAFHIPDWALRGLIIFLVLGFVPAVAFAWVFEMTPEGIKRDDEVPPERSIAPHTARRMDRMIIAVLLAALCYFGLEKFVLAPTRQATEIPVAETKVRAEAQAATSEKSIAVLPFVDMSQEHDQEYFSDGIAEELLNRLAQIPELRVAARTSAFQFKGQNLDIADIGRKLNVAHVLEGSVRKSGNRLRITAQLINSATGFHLWSQTFEGDAGDVFKVQDEIATAITQALQAKLAGRSGPLKPTVAVDPQAYDDYLRGRSYFALRDGDNLKLAVAAFDRAIARDPSYAAAHAGRAFALAISEIWTPWLPTEEIRVQSRASADRALALDPDNVEALTARGVMALFRLDIAGAHADLERAYALAPDAVDVLNFNGDFLLSTGDLRGAERMKRKAILLDPLAWVHPKDLGIVLSAQKRYAEAVAMDKLGAATGYQGSLNQLVRDQLSFKQFDEARRTLERVCRGQDAQSKLCLKSEVNLLGSTGRIEEARAAMANLVIKFPPVTSRDHAVYAATYANYLDNIAEATRTVRLSLREASNGTMIPLLQSNRGALLPEEISQDPEWLAVWADPKLSELMTEYRKNIETFRKGG